MNLTITVQDQASPALKAAIAKVRGESLVLAMAGGVRVALRDHFAGLESTRPNRMGYPRTHFWSDVRGTVQVPQTSSPQTATVAITHLGVRQRLEGGKITPVKGEYLTIPANDQAYGHRAREFSNLYFGFAENRYGNLAPALLEGHATKISIGRKRKDGTRKVKNEGAVGGAVFFWLVRQVYQPADPDVLPSAARLEQAARDGGEEYVTALADQVAANRAARSAERGGAK